MKTKDTKPQFDQSGAFYQLFYKLSEFITSLAPVLLFLFLFMGYRFYEVQTLFLDKLPSDLGGDGRHFAANMIAVVFIFTTLLFMVNASRSIKWGKYFLAIVAFIINLYFWNAFQGNTEDILFKLFISAVIASMDFGFAHLFDNMWKERLDHVDKEIIGQSKDQLIQQIAELEQTKSLEEQKLATIELETEVAQQALNKRIAKIDDHSCPHCGSYYESIKALNGHLGQCKERRT